MMTTNTHLLEKLVAAKCAHQLRFSQREIVHIEISQGEPQGSEPQNGVWHGTQMHICADGFCETATFGYGDDIRCARCEEFYNPARDDTL